MASSEFSTRPFVAGSLIGIRTYRVAGDGTLTGVHVRQVVTPGENLARCETIHRVYERALKEALAKAMGQPLPEPAPHQLVTLKCSCGFYAYFDGSDEYMRSYTSSEVTPRIEAIVEGYGCCVVGSRGFRAEKLRLVAIIRADDDPAPRAERVLDRAARWVMRHTKAAGRGAGALTGASVFTFDLFGWKAAAVHVVLGLAGSVGVARLLRRGFRLDTEDYLRRLFGRAPAPAAADWDLIKATYPDVPVYLSRRAALAAHPLTVPSAP